MSARYGVWYSARTKKKEIVRGGCIRSDRGYIYSVGSLPVSSTPIIITPFSLFIVSKMSYSGSCLCGNVSFKLEGEPATSFVCYCVDCRKGSGHLGQFISKYDTSKVSIEDKNNSLKEYVVEKTKSGSPKKKEYCGECGCTIRTLPMKFNGEVSMMRQTLVDGTLGTLAPKNAIFGPEKDSFTDNVKSELY